MATRQYIGARYVTKIYENSLDPSSAEWEASVNYEPLTLVTYNNGSYLSKKTVPGSVGNPASNPTYWAQTGFYNGQITSILNTLSQIRAGVATPEQYGAAGDGVTDDTTALQNAVNGSEIVILTGTYLVSSSINVPDGVTIIGGTIKASTYMYTLNVGDYVNVEGVTFVDTMPLENEWAHVYGNECSYVTVKDCVFHNIGFGYAIEFVHSNNIEIEHNDIESYSFSGIMLLATCSNCKVNYNNVKNSRWYGAADPNMDHNYPICISGYDTDEFGAANNIDCCYNIIEESNAWWEGIDSHGCNNYRIIGNIIKGVYRGIACGYRQTGGTIFPKSNSNSEIKDNYIVTALPSDPSLNVPNGIHIAGDAGNSLDNLTIANNTIECRSNNTSSEHAGYGAISISNNGGDINGVKITNNSITVESNNAIGVGATDATNVIIEGNTIYNLDNAYYGVYVHYIDDYSNIIVRDNISIDDHFIVNKGFIRGPLVASSTGYLLEVVNNVSNMEYSNVDYTTYPHPSGIIATQKNNGVPLQFIPATITGVYGYQCKSTGSWESIASTPV